MNPETIQNAIPCPDPKPNKTSTHASNDLEPLLIRRICQNISAWVPCNMRSWSSDIDGVDNFSSLNVSNPYLLFFLVVGACGDEAPVKRKVDRLDKSWRQLESAHADPLLCVPQRDERVSTTGCEEFSAW